MMVELDAYDVVVVACWQLMNEHIMLELVEAIDAPSIRSGDLAGKRSGNPLSKQWIREILGRQLWAWGGRGGGDEIPMHKEH